jgi:cell fate regulator YaaT (PSP1 superfamily)
VRFKNGRKEFYRNTENITLSMGDIVATEASPGHDIGIVTLTGELVKIQMKKKGANPDGDVLKIYRKASQKDIDIWSEARNREEPMKVVAREIAIRLNLEMKISDIEFQGDSSKATFYYTANDRVDFRQLIKDFAREFSIRIEMKQVGFRQEASRLGGIGSCGRELCCSTWLTDFRSVNTSAARYQQLSLNPQKLAGQCGKLKCCLNYELDTYLDALKGMPDMDTKLYTEKGDAFCQKIDIFKGLMWFAYTNDMAHWHILEADQVKEIVALNKQKERVASLEDYAVEAEEEAPEKNFQNAVGQDSLTRFDAPKRRKKKPSRGKGQDNKDAVAAPAQGSQIIRPQGQNTQQQPQQRNNKPQREPREGQEPRENRQPRENREPREPRTDNRGPREPRTDNRGPKEPRPAGEPRQPRPERGERTERPEKGERQPRQERQPRPERQPKQDNPTAGQQPAGEGNPNTNNNTEGQPNNGGNPNRRHNNNRNKKRPPGDQNGNDKK